MTRKQKNPATKRNDENNRMKTELLNNYGMLLVLVGLIGLFSVLTLPVEIGASRRALVMLREGGMLNGPEDASGARSVLIAAALTYVAAAVTSVLTLLDYISIARR